LEIWLGEIVISPNQIIQQTEEKYNHFADEGLNIDQKVDNR
jgi:ssRNA-specific RNase YbeY (16S rRNA maturation enzyme)